MPGLNGATGTTGGTGSAGKEGTTGATGGTGKDGQTGATGYSGSRGELRPVTRDRDHTRCTVVLVVEHCDGWIVREKRGLCDPVVKQAIIIIV